MFRDTDTKALERGEIRQESRKPIANRFSPVLISFVFLALIAIACIVVVAKRTQRMKPTGAMEAAYVGNVKARDFIKSITADEPVATPPIPKFNHVIFRLGDAEMFRFTYEDGGEGLHYSFEAREGR